MNPINLDFHKWLKEGEVSYLKFKDANGVSHNLSVSKLSENRYEFSMQYGSHEPYIGTVYTESMAVNMFDLFLSDELYGQGVGVIFPEWYEPIAA